MPLTLSVALVVLVAIIVVGAVAYWIDEAEEPLEHGDRMSNHRHHRV